MSNTKWLVSVLIVVLMVVAFTNVVLAEEETETVSTESTGTSEAGVEPVQVDGNPLSGDGADNHKVDNPDPGDEGTKEVPCGIEPDDLGDDYPDTSENETVEIDYEVSDDGKYLSWESKDEVETVTVKGGDSANVYYYYDDDGNYLGLWNSETGMWYDSGLHAPLNQGGNIPEISNFGFFADCPDNGGNGDNGNGGNGDNGNGNGYTGNGSNGTFVGFEMPTSVPKATPLALPQTGGSNSLIWIAIFLVIVGLTTIYSTNFHTIKNNS